MTIRPNKNTNGLSWVGLDCRVGTNNFNSYFKYLINAKFRLYPQKNSQKLMK